MLLSATPDTLPAAPLPPPFQEEVWDLDQKIDTGKLIDSAGAGRSMFSPGWLTQLNQLWGGKSVSASGCGCQPCPAHAILGCMNACIYRTCSRLPPTSALRLRALQSPQLHQPRHCTHPAPRAPLQNVPMANAQPDDIQDLLGGALFKALFKWMVESGPIYLLPTGAHAALCCAATCCASIPPACVGMC